MFAAIFLASSSAGGSVGGIIGLLVGVLEIVALWKIFSKAGRAGWLAIIPIVNYAVLLQIAGKPWWWVFGIFIPILNVIVYIVMFYGTAKAFGQSTAFAIGTVILAPIFLLILGFGSAQYQGAGSGTRALAGSFS